MPSRLRRNSSVRSVLALRALWFAIVAPWRLKESTTGAAVATFALAVLLGAFAAASTQMWEHSDAALNREGKQFAVVTGTSQVANEGGAIVPLDSAGRQFTALLGNNLLVLVLSLLISTAVYMFLGRFLTNEKYTFQMALLCVSASTSIFIVGSVVASAIHLATHSMRFGVHAGAFVDPLQSPFLFLFLQRIDAFSIWQALATGVGLTTWVGLDRRYGYVVGAVVWLTVLLVFFGVSSLISWILAQGLAR